MDEEREGNWPPARVFVNAWVCSIHFLPIPGGGKNNKEVGKCFKLYVIWSCFKNVQLLSHNLIFS